MQYNAHSKDDCPSQTGKLQEFLSIIIICSSQMYTVILKENDLLSSLMAQICEY